MGLGRKWWAGVLVLGLSLSAAGCDPAGEAVPDPAEHTYANPITLADEWGEYGLGDPFIFSYNGYYYLYVSTRDTDTGIKVWRSEDLVNWTYEGLCTEEAVTAAAYAPEVRYWNGKFYMYTSPAGQGHYALTSDSPTGPFTVATDNFGRTIDGSTFVDDDGRWYFYYAGSQGIQAAPMADPLTVEPEEVQTGAYMGGWTEGPTVFKRGGKYYMTYTGNHVFSTGYRVDAAVSGQPLEGFAGFAGNPVLLRSEGATVGLGHNSIVTGPDLDAEYMIYHNLEGPGVVGPLRHMNMDRIVWNGERFSVWGPTTGPQPVPQLPAFADRFERAELGGDWKTSGGGSWTVDAENGLQTDSRGAEGSALLLTKAETGGSYTAEFHVQVQEGQAAGAVFSYKDESNYGIVLLDRAAGEIRAEIYRKGRLSYSDSAVLPENFDPGQLQNLRLEVSGRIARVYAATMHLLDLKPDDAIGGGSIGYAAADARARFGYVAFSNEVDGSSTREAYAPLPGTIDAVNVAAAGGKGNDDDITSGEDGTQVRTLSKGAELTYRVNVEQSGAYALHFRISPGAAGVRFSLWDGKTRIMPALTVTAEAGTQPWQIVTAQDVKLEPGFHQWKLKVEQGEMKLDWLKAAAYAPVEPETAEFEAKNDFRWTRYEGEWSFKDGQLRSSSVTPAKILFGDYGWTDYTVDADFTVPEAGGQTGILVRATDPSNGLELNQNRNDFICGYYIYLDDQGIHLAKLNYATQPLADIPYDLPQAGEMMHLKVTAEGARITVYAEGGSTPVLDYTDRGVSPLLQGKTGFKSAGTAARFERMTVEK